MPPSFIALIMLWSRFQYGPGGMVHVEPSALAAAEKEEDCRCVVMCWGETAVSPQHLLN
ncbi:MAG: hypothetical protein GY805_03225 [Chloroflexi bacterium]|nr:hypothetical protein [Chloroflexota bacterium]